MAQFHAVMIDECGSEFGVTINADDRGAAYEKLADDYPESRVDQLEDHNDTARRVSEMRARISAEIDGDYFDGEDF